MLNHGTQASAFCNVHKVNVQVASEAFSHIKVAKASKIPRFSPLHLNLMELMEGRLEDKESSEDET